MTQDIVVIRKVKDIKDLSDRIKQLGIQFHGTIQEDIQDDGTVLYRVYQTIKLDTHDGTG